MKKLNILYLFLTLTMILGSCGSSNNVVSNRLISKRKYNNGFHFNNNGNYKKSNDDAAKVEEKMESKDLKPSVEKTTTSADLNRKSTEPTIYSSNETAMEQVASTDKIDSDSPSNESSVPEKSSNTNSKVQKDNTPEEYFDNSKSEFIKMKKVKGKKGGGSDSMFILAVICAIILPPLGVAIYTNIDWMKVLIALLLTLLFYLPGLIYALLVLFGRI